MVIRKIPGVAAPCRLELLEIQLSTGDPSAPLLTWGDVGVNISSNAASAQACFDGRTAAGSPACATAPADASPSVTVGFGCEGANFTASGLTAIDIYTDAGGAYAADTGNFTVEVFSASGAREAAFNLTAGGSRQSFAMPGGLAPPTAELRHAARRRL